MSEKSVKSAGSAPSIRPPPKDEPKSEAKAEPKVKAKSGGEDGAKPAALADKNVRAHREGESSFETKPRAPVDLSGGGAPAARPEVKAETKTGTKADEAAAAQAEQAAATHQQQQQAEVERRQRIETTLRQSETASRTLDELQRQGVTYEFVDGQASSWDGQRLSIGRDLTDDQAAMTLIQEANHAIASKTGTTPDPSKMSREDYVAAMMDEEARGTALQAQTIQELRAKGVDTSGMNPGLADRYLSAYDAAVAGGASAEAARAAGTAAVKQGYLDGDLVTLGEGRSYPGHYATQWDRVAAGEIDPSRVVKPDGEDVISFTKKGFDAAIGALETIGGPDATKLAEDLKKCWAAGAGDAAINIFKGINLIRDGHIMAGLTQTAQGAMDAIGPLSEIFNSPALRRLAGPLGGAATMLGGVNRMNYGEDGTGNPDASDKIVGAVKVAAGLFQMGPPPYNLGGTLAEVGIDIADKSGVLDMALNAAGQAYNQVSQQVSDAWNSFVANGSGRSEEWLQQAYDARGLPRPAARPTAVPAGSPGTTTVNAPSSTPNGPPPPPVRGPTVPGSTPARTASPPPAPPPEEPLPPPAPAPTAVPAGTQGTTTVNPPYTTPSGPPPPAAPRPTALPR
jgi:hypothetical protein